MYELALIVMGLGISFFLVYLARSFEANNWISIALKVLMFGTAMYLLFFPISYAHSLTLFANETSTNAMNGTTFTTLNNLTAKHMSALEKATFAIAAFSFIYMLWLIFQALKGSADKAADKKGWDPL